VNLIHGAQGRQQFQKQTWKMLAVVTIARQCSVSNVQAAQNGREPQISQLFNSIVVITGQKPV
jgi:hypothetical protein